MGDLDAQMSGFSFPDWDCCWECLISNRGFQLLLQLVLICVFPVFSRLKVSAPNRHTADFRVDDAAQPVERSRQRDGNGIPERQWIRKSAEDEEA